jgi:hypothetical protein
MSAKTGTIVCCEVCRAIYGAFGDSPMGARSDAAVAGWETAIHGVEPRRKILDYCPAHELTAYCTDCLARITKRPGAQGWEGAGLFDCQHYPNRRTVAPPSTGETNRD